MSIGANSQTEVTRLHEFFVEWFNATLQNADEVFTRVERALHPDFSMVLPSGETIDRQTTLDQIRSAHGSARRDKPSRIEIVDITTQADGTNSALVSYQERQFAGDVLLNRRASSAYFVVALDAPCGVQWRRLHETMLTAAP